VNVTYLYNNTTEYLHSQDFRTKPTETQLKSLPMDNLVEFAGRICYDSLGGKGRPTQEYHRHINEVNHGSVQEHGWVFVNFIGLNGFELADALAQCINRPGVFIYYKDVEPDDGKVRHNVTVVANLRSIKEWKNFDSVSATGLSKSVLNIGEELLIRGKMMAPFVLDHLPNPVSKWRKPITYSSKDMVNPQESIYISFLIEGVSRNLTHELVRHKFQTAISQRSTRYVDESSSPIAWHPLLLRNKFTWPLRKISEITTSWMYSLSEWLVRKDLEKLGLGKVAAQKQSRGAARSFRPTALSTELVFTASLAQWNRIIAMRGNEHADAEIRLMANKVYYILHDLYSNFNDNLIKDYSNITPSKDGVANDLK